MLLGNKADPSCQAAPGCELRSIAHLGDHSGAGLGLLMRAVRKSKLPAPGLPLQSETKFRTRPPVMVSEHNHGHLPAILPSAYVVGTSSTRQRPLCSSGR